MIGSPIPFRLGGHTDVPGARGRRRRRRELPVGQAGELYFEGGPDFEYFKDPAKTASVYNEHGWRSLGDMGYVDEDGYLYLTDRSTFMIVSGGVNIYPQEAENLLVMHPKLADAAVWARRPQVRRARRGGQGRRATCPRRHSWPDLEAELIEYCRAHLAGLQVPAHSRVRPGIALGPERKALQEDASANFTGRGGHHGSCEPTQGMARWLLRWVTR